MTYAQQTTSLQPLFCDGPLLARGARRLRSRRAGRLVVASGRAWLTRQGDLDDHVLSAGQALHLHANEQVVVEPWVGGTPVRLWWRSDQPRTLALRVAEAALALRAGLARALAATLAAAGTRLLAWARTAEANASRAQGSISRGESSASLGALQ